MDVDVLPLLVVVCRAVLLGDGILDVVPSDGDGGDGIQRSIICVCTGRSIKCRGVGGVDSFKMMSGGGWTAKSSATTNVIYIVQSSNIYIYIFISCIWIGERVYVWIYITLCC